MERQANVHGDPLEVCSLDPMTGFYRDGFTTSGPDDVGSHTVCTVLTPEFLEHQRQLGNDLVTPRPEYGFAGLQPGDRWAVCASRWYESFAAGVRAPVVLRATNIAALDDVPEDALLECAADAPDDLSSLLD